MKTGADHSSQDLARAVHVITPTASVFDAVKLTADKNFGTPPYQSSEFSAT